MIGAHKLKIIVFGYIVRCPLGGIAWHYLQYVKGLADMGHEVLFYEDSGDSLYCCYDPSRGISDIDPSYGLQFTDILFRRLGLKGKWIYYDAHSSNFYGTSSEKFKHMCKDTDLLINFSMSVPLRSWFDSIHSRALIDTDPVFTQIRHLTDIDCKARALEHNSFFTFGGNIHNEDCTIPDDGLPWIPTKQPVVLSNWDMTPGKPEGKFTTVMQWDSYKPREYNGMFYGMKSSSFTPFYDLPGLTTDTFELAVGQAPRKLLVAKGWLLEDPLKVTKDPWTYKHYIQQSKAEFGVAKHGYVDSRSGWFSERSAAYLASGRPVIVQDTGFGSWLPSGKGILSFNRLEDAVGCVEDLNRNYDSNCLFAREIAEQYFDSKKVLSEVIEKSMN
jgi:hypothetical protein